MSLIDKYIRERSQNDREFRDAFDAESINLDVAVQIRLRKRNGLSQCDFTNSVNVKPKVVPK